MLLAKKETALQGTTDRLNEFGKWYGIEINMIKRKVMRIARQPSPVRIITDQKHPQNVKYFNYLDCRTPNGKMYT